MTSDEAAFEELISPYRSELYAHCYRMLSSSPSGCTPWRLVPVRANGQLAFACYQGEPYRLGAINVLTLRAGRIAELSGFLDPAVHRYFNLPEAMNPSDAPTLIR